MTGRTDWDYYTKSDIVAQTIAQLSVDIAAQTLAALNVDITAQTLGNLAMDIAAQSVGNLGVDINAQSVGNLAVDLAAQTVGNVDINVAGQTGNVDVNLAAQAANVDVNLASQSGDVDVNLAAQDSNITVDLAAQSLANMDVDINAQSVGNIDIDVVSQTLGELINRPKYGGGLVASWTANVAASTNQTLFTVNGTGMLYGGFVNSVAASTHKVDEVYVYVDGNLLFYSSFQNLLNMGLCSPVVLPVYLKTFNDVAFVYTVGFMYGVTFESSIQVKYYNKTGSSTYVTGKMIYATI